MMEWLLRYATRVAVRRVVYLVIASIVGLALQLCSGAAHAGQCSSEVDVRSDDGCIDQGEAWAMGVLAYNKWASEKVPNAQKSLCPAMPIYSGPTMIGVEIRATFQGGACGTGFTIYRYFPAGSTCTARNSTRLADAGLGYSQPSTCVGGCQVQGTPFSNAFGGVMVYGMKDRTYSGDVCAPDKPSQDIGEAAKEKEDATKQKAPECNALGNGQTGCQKPNGDYCATASTGKTFCWQPQEAGKKVDGADAQVKSKKGEPVTPPDIKIDDQDWQRTQGHQQTACVNSTCTTYNVTNYQTTPSGTAKNSTGDNNADGSGNTSGNGKPSKGEGDKEGEDSASESGNCDTAPACTGDTLKCLQLKFTWKIECNTKGNEITKGNGCGSEDVPVCVGKSCKAEAYSQLLQQWRQRCAAEGDRDAAGRDAASGAADASGDDLNGVVGRLWKGDGTVPSLDQGRVSVGGGPVIPEVDIMGTTFSIPQSFYDALAIIKKLIIASAMIAAFWILWNR